MELNYLFDNFIKPKPSAFLKIISYNYTLKKEQILKYYPMLFWGKEGLKDSPNVDWDYDLSQRFEKQLTENYPTCWKDKEKNIHFNYLSFKKSTKLSSTFLKNEKLATKSIEKIEKAGLLNFDKINEIFLEKYHRILRKDDWIKIAKNYQGIFTIEMFKKYWRELDSADLILYNENINWKNPEIYMHFINSKEWLLSCSSILWNKLYKPLLNDQTLEYLIERIRDQKKVFNMRWVDMAQGKYYIEIFLKTEHHLQVIDKGYCFLNKTIELNKLYHFPDNFKITTSNHKSVIDNKNIRTLVFEPY